MNLIRCDKCHFTSLNPDLFSTICYYFADKKVLKKLEKSLVEKWDEQERLNEEADFVNSGLKAAVNNFEDSDGGYVTLHLCMRCSERFENSFIVKKIRRRKT